MEIIKAFIKPIIAHALAEKKENANVGEAKDEVVEGETMLSHLVRSTEDEKIVFDEILNMLIAGEFVLVV